MKKILLTLSCLIAGYYASAQQPFKTTEYIDIGNIKAAHHVHGDMWYNSDSMRSDCEFPKGSGKNIGSLGSLWMAGYDAQNTLCLSAQTYRQAGNDYWPGPIADSIYTTSVDRAQAWNRIWKVNRATIDSFRAITNHTVANTPAVIMEWPANGNLNAKGSAGHTLTVNREMAPFVDVNNDGNYNPLNGDYPQIKGDQMLWWLINDLGPTHDETNGLQMGVEVVNIAYAFNRPGIAKNIIFYEYSVTNKSIYPYNDFRLGFNADLDINYAYDDLYALDLAKRACYFYNGTPVYPGVIGIPFGGIVQLEVPSDLPGQYTELGSFVPYANDATFNGSPTNPTEFNHMLREMRKDGVFIDKHNTYTVDSTMCNMGPVFSDMRFVLASNNNNLAANQTLHYAFALIASPDNGACPNPDFTVIQATADTAWNIYWNPLLPSPTGIASANTTARTLSIYPNPATSILNITTPDAQNGTVTITDAAGKTMQVSIEKNGQKITVNTSPLAPGIYIVQYLSGQTKANNIFVKQ